MIAAREIVVLGQPFAAGWNEDVHETDAASRLFLTLRWVMLMVRPEAQVIGAERAKGFNTRVSLNGRGHPISLRIRTPVKVAESGKQGDGVVVWVLLESGDRGDTEPLDVGAFGVEGGHPRQCLNTYGVLGRSAAADRSAR